jgi:hypothetical protein
VVSVMLIHVLNIKLTCESHEAIKSNYKDTATHVILVLRFPRLYILADSDVTLLTAHSKPFTTVSVRRHDITLYDKC